jgi:hypothetical protein
VDSGGKEKKMDRVIWNFQIKSTITVLLWRVWKRASGFKFLSMETNTRESIKMENSTEKENIHGLMVPAMRVSLRKEWGKDREVGNLPKITEISTSAPMRLTRKTDTEDTFGPMDACTREDFSTMWSK